MSRAENQVALKRSFRLYTDTMKRVQEYADKHAMSRSEVVRVAMERYSQGRVPATSRLKQRVEIWIADAKLYRRFSTKVERDGIQIADAIEAAFSAMEDEG